jgi:hypothetical protein
VTDKGDRYLLARWAEALEPFEEIEARMRSLPGRLASLIRGLALRAPDLWIFAVLGGMVTSIVALGGLYPPHPNPSVIRLSQIGVWCSLAAVVAGGGMLWLRSLRHVAARLAGWVVVD